MANDERHIELILKEVQVQKLNLQPGEVLVVQLKGDDFTEYDAASLRMGFESLIPNNKVAILTVPEQASIELTTLEGSKYPSYCGDCGCGKKEVAEAMIQEDLKKKEES